MSYRTPTSRRKKKAQQGLNLIPILDSVFIFIFFLLMSAQFVKIFEINSDVPLISNEEPPKNKDKPLALTVTIDKNGFVISTGVPSTTIKKINKMTSKDYDLATLHDFLVQLKKQNKKENTVVLEPVVDITYEEIVKIMDSVRMLKKTDDSIYIQDKDGIDIKIEKLFDNIIFGNLMS